MMARASFLTFTIILFLFFLTTPISLGNMDDIPSIKKLLSKKEKLTHMQVYWHDIFSGPQPTAKTIIPPNFGNAPPFSFGSVTVMDDPLTLGPELSSKTIGRAQGIYALDSQEQMGLTVIMSFVFTEGKYNGSTINILGSWNWNGDPRMVRELSVVGGNGLFRFARGYVKAVTHDYDDKTGDTTVKYDLYIIHY